MPAVTHLGCDSRVARLAKTHEVTEVMSTTVSQRNNMVHLCCRSESSFLQTLFTHGVSMNVSISYLLPPGAIPFLLFLGPAVLFILLVHKLLMLLAVPLLR